MEAWKEPFFVDIAVLTSEFFTDPERHISTFTRTMSQSPEYWLSLNNELSAQGLEENEINLRLHNVFLATLIQQRREQIEELHSLVAYEPSDDIIDLLSQMSQLDTENQPVS